MQFFGLAFWAKKFKLVAYAQKCSSFPPPPPVLVYLMGDRKICVGPIHKDPDYYEKLQQFLIHKDPNYYEKLHQLKFTKIQTTMKSFTNFQVWFDFEVSQRLCPKLYTSLTNSNYFVDMYI